jgi:hypothetical protein
VRIRPNAGDELISQVHTAMQMYRARTELSADGLADLEQLFAAAPYPVTRATETMYQATVTWLLLHEVGHAIGDMAGLAPPARWFLDALPFALDEERYKRWADELSADFNASRHLAGALRKQLSNISSRPALDLEQAAWSLGFGAGIVALAAFELYQEYDAGPGRAS